MGGKVALTGGLDDERVKEPECTILIYRRDSTNLSLHDVAELRGLGGNCGEGYQNNLRVWGTLDLWSLLGQAGHVPIIRPGQGQFIIN